MESSLTFTFPCAIRGFHFYKDWWIPSLDEEHACHHEENNLYDIFMIKVCQQRGKRDIVVGHLPMEISCPTKFLIQRGVIVIARVSKEHYRRSPLIKGGMEIPCTVYVQMARTIPNEACLKWYQEIVSERYAEPEEEEILGSVSTIADEDNMTVLQDKCKNNKLKNPNKSKNLSKNKTRC